MLMFLEPSPAMTSRDTSKATPRAACLELARGLILRSRTSADPTTSMRQGARIVNTKLKLSSFKFSYSHTQPYSGLGGGVGFCIDALSE